MFIMFLLSGNDATCISPESRPLIFVYLYLRTQSNYSDIVKYDTKSKLNNILKKPRLPIK